MIRGSSLVDGYDEPDAPDYGNNAGMPDEVGEAPAQTTNNRAPDEAKPMFTLDPIKYQPKGLLRLQASNDIIIMALDNSHVIRVNLRNPQDLDDVEISRKPDDPIHRIFLDPTGSHLIVAMASQESYYLHISWKKPKPLPKMKGIVIESVAWDKTNTDTTNTGSILIGTRNGQIFETWIEAKDKLFADSKEKFFRPLFHTNEDRPISGLRMERFPSANPTDPPKYFVMATTANRIYQFIGGPSFEQLFQPYESNPGFYEVPGTLSYSELQFMGPQQGLAKSFSWLTGPGIYHGGLVFGSQNPGDNVMTDTSLLAYPARKGAPQATFAPIGLAMTEFHFLVLFDDRIQAISRLNDELVWEETWNQSRTGRMRGLTFDAITNTLWLYSDRLVWMILIVEEDRKVWEAYLRKGMYETALSFCKTLQQKDYVWSTQAEHYFSQGSFALAATYYSKTKRSFEEVCLKFLTIGERDALKTYLLHKLEHLAPSDAMQITVICTWLVELYLNRLDQLKEGGNEAAETLKATMDEFKQFLADNKDNNRLDHATTYTLIASHGHIDILLFYATQVEDFERVISHHIQQGEFGKALSAMSRQTNADVYYKFSPILMFVAPFHTVNAWMRASKILEPKKLIPSLMRYSPERNPPNEKQNQAIRYLQYCVNELNNQDPAIHNFLLSLYAKEDDDTELLRFLAKENASYDLKYALRLCTKEQKLRACVHIYGRMGLYEEAVDLALRVDLELAKLYADKPDQAEDQELRKKLWLRIARHVVEYGKDIKAAMQFLTHCELLKIEDILPFFPDFVLIDDFKEAICSSLTNYNHNIEELKVDMDDATKSANLIRADIIELRNKHGMVAGNQKCDLCGFPAISRAFYLFPCQHIFHHDCLLRDVIPRLSNVDKMRVGELQQRLANPSAAAATPVKRTAAPEETSTNAQLDQTKTELDDIIARECLFCGEAMIASIDQPFEADSASSIRLD